MVTETPPLKDSYDLEDGEIPPTMEDELLMNGNGNDYKDIQVHVLYCCICTYILYRSLME